MRRRLKASEVNHLRRLLGWVRCEVGQPPEEMVAMVQDLIPRIGPIGDDGKQRLVAAHQKAASVPKYVRAAIKALECVCLEDTGETIAAEIFPAKTRKPRRLIHRNAALSNGGKP